MIKGFPQFCNLYLWITKSTDIKEFDSYFLNRSLLHETWRQPFLEHLSTEIVDNSSNKKRDLNNQLIIKNTFLSYWLFDELLLSALAD